LSGEIRNIKGFFRPLGPQTQVKSNVFSETFLIHDEETQEMLASVEIGFEDRAVRINFLLKKNVRIFQQRIEKQLRKLQSCIFCGSCEAKCPQKALTSSGDYSVDNNKCVSCLHCVSYNCPVVKSLHYNGIK
jgi:phosphoadenosine phosphosulfate reductase